MTTDSNTSDNSVDSVLQEVQLRIRQRQAELATYQAKNVPAQRTQLSQQLTKLRAKSLVREQPFVSKLPLVGPVIAWFRHSWNNIAARWHVWHILKQQNSFNQAVVETFQELVYTQNRLAQVSLQLEIMEQKIKDLEQKVHHGNS